MTDEYLLSPESGENELSLENLFDHSCFLNISDREKSNKNFRFTSKLPEIGKNL